MQWSQYFWRKVAKLSRTMPYSDAYNYYRLHYQQTGLSKYIEPITK